MGENKDKSAESIEEEKPETSEEEASKTDEKEVEKPAEDEKKDVESLRKIIKVDQTEEKKDEEPSEDNKKEEKPNEPVKEDKGSSKKGGSVSGDEATETNHSSDRESLEQKRAILQNIKDFDFQIKKNQEELSNVNKKIDEMSKDLDDLVSLYEIVSEQMNPFVGLSKVTKKRLDALENFTIEIDGLKERMGEMESFAERSGAKIQSLGQIRQKVKTIDADAILAQMDNIGEKEDKESERTEGAEESEKKISEEEIKQVETPNSEGELAKETSDKKAVETEKLEVKEVDTSSINEAPDEKDLQPIPEKKESEDIFDRDIFGNISTGETLQPISVDLAPLDYDIIDNSFDLDLDMIFDMAFGTLSASAEGKIDIIIDEFIESLKGQNVN